MRIPTCQGQAVFDTAKQADYVADGLTLEFGVIFDAVPCGSHFHVEDSGVPYDCS